MTTAYQHGYYTNFRNRIWVVALPFQTLSVFLSAHTKFKLELYMNTHGCLFFHIFAS